MQNIPQIRLNTLTKKKIEKIAEGTKIYDIDSKSYYEKINDEFQIMIEENNNDNFDEKMISYDQVIKDIEDVKKIVLSGNKLAEVNAFMQFKTLRNTVLSQKDMTREKINFMFNGTSEEIDLIEARTSEVTKEALNTASFEELREFFIFDDKEITLNISSEAFEEKEKEEAYRTFLLYLKDINDINKSINEQVKKIDFILDNFSDEVKEKSKNLQIWDEYIYDLFKEKMESQELTVEERERIQRVIRLKEDAITLKPIYDFIKQDMDQGRRTSLIHAFKNRFEDTIKKSEKYALQNGFQIYFNLFDGIEEMFGYDDYRNLFVYVFARYIKYNQEKMSRLDNAFIAQIIQNLILLKNKQIQEPKKTNFINAIKSILDLIVNPIG